MNNLFVHLIKKANELNWCTKPYCTTCGARDYRNELKRISNNHKELSNILSAIHPNEITKIDNWRGALTIAFIDLNSLIQTENILDSWFPRIRINVDFADLVLFKIVRYLPSENETRKKWIQECIDIALEEKYFSLVESLILILGKEILKQNMLYELAREFAKSSKQMRRVMFNKEI